MSRVGFINITPARVFQSNGYDLFYTAGNVGIGTSAPSNQLDVSGNVAINGNVNIDSGALFVNAANNRVGIGMTTPSTTLDVSGAMAISGMMTVSNDVDISGTSMLRLSNTANNTRIIATCSNGAFGTIEATQANDNITKRPLGLNAYGGNVGIGKTNPSVALDVNGATTISGNLTVDTNTLFVDAASNRVGIGMNNPSKALEINGSARVSSTLDVSGVTTLSGNLNVRLGGNGTFDSAVEFNNQTRINFSTATGHAFILSRTGTDSQQILQMMMHNSVAVGSISVSGTSTTYSTSSDYRLKENVQPMTGALEQVSLLKPCTYTWKSNGNSGQGFIAHELAEVCPDAVSGTKDAVDEDGDPIYQGIDTSFLVATLTAATQELSRKVVALEEELNSTKQENAQLKSRLDQLCAHLGVTF